MGRLKGLNALNAVTLTELLQAATELELDPAVRVILLTGAGEKAFIAGADISQVAGYTARTALDSDLQRLFDLVEDFPKPTIAAVNAIAYGGGCEMAMACDFRIAAEAAVFGQPEINLGIIPGAGGTQRLTRAFGKSKAMDMVLTGRLMDAQEAERANLVSRVVPAGVPRRTPEVTIGFSGSKGMAFLLQVRCARFSAASAALPVTRFGRRSTSRRWLSVPPVTRSRPCARSSSASAFALATTALE